MVCGHLAEKSAMGAMWYSATWRMAGQVQLYWCTGNIIAGEEGYSTEDTEREAEH